MKKPFKKLCNWFKVLYNKLILFSNSTKVERLIYVVMLWWIIFGILGIKYTSNLTEIAGYYASLSLFISSYIWGEYKRSSKATKLFDKGPNSVREITIYFTLVLWFCLGIYGIIKNADFSKLTVYFASLAPFVNSFIIYETSRKDKKGISSNIDKLKDIVDNVLEKEKNNEVEDEEDKEL